MILADVRCEKLPTPMLAAPPDRSEDNRAAPLVEQVGGLRHLP
jgi:hypothetical protein